LSVPVKVGFYAGNKRFSFAKVGLVPSLLTGAITQTPTFDKDRKITGANRYILTNTVSKFDLAGLIEMGGGYKIVDRLWVTLSFLYLKSLTSITNKEYFADTKIRHNGMSMYLGLQWTLKEK
jgi:hypothetical protein